MRLFLRHNRFSLLLAVYSLLVLFVTYPGNSSAQIPMTPQCKSYIHPIGGPGASPCSPAPSGCTQDGYPAITAAIWPPACFGTDIYSKDGKNTFAGSSIPPGNYVSSQNGPTGYECWELAQRYWYFRFKIDLAKWCPGCFAGNLVINNFPANAPFKRYPADGSYIPVCGDIIAFCGSSGACPGSSQLDHVDVIAQITGTPGPGEKITTLNEDTVSTDPWGLNGSVTNPLGTGNNDVAYLHALNNSSTGNTCSDATAIMGCNALLEPFARYAYNSGIAVVRDGRGDLNIFSLYGGNGIYQANDNNAWTSWQNWMQLVGTPGLAAHDPVAITHPSGKMGNMMDLFFLGEDGNIWIDWQSGWWNFKQIAIQTLLGNPVPVLPPWSLYPSNVPMWAGPTGLIQGWTWLPPGCNSAGCHKGTWLSTQLVMPAGVVPASNLSLGLDSGDLIHIIFYGASTDKTTGDPVTNIYDIEQATAHNEYSVPPYLNVWNPPVMIAQGYPVKHPGDKVIIPPKLSEESIPSGHPTVIADQNKTLHVFFMSDDTMKPKYDHGFIFHIYQTAIGWSKPEKIKVTQNGGTIYPVTTSNPNAVLNADGRLELFFRGADGKLWHVWQTSAGTSAKWDAPAQLGESVTSDPVSAFNKNGTLQVFFRDEQQHVRTLVRNNLNNGPTGVWGCHTDISALSGQPVPGRPYVASPLSVGVSKNMFADRIQLFFDTQGDISLFSLIKNVVLGDNGEFVGGVITHIMQSAPNANSRCSTDAATSAADMALNWGWGAYPYFIRGVSYPFVPGDITYTGGPSILIPSYPSFNVEYTTCYGSAGNNNITACQGLDDFIKQFEAYVPWCYGDANDHPCSGPSDTVNGNCTFGIGTFTLLPQSGKLCGLPAGEIACDICKPPVSGGFDAYAGLGCATQAEATQAKTCAYTLLNDYLKTEIQSLFGPGGLVKNPSILNACQQAALIDFDYQYPGCVGGVIGAINSGNLTAAVAHFMDCSGYTSRRQAEQKLWNENPCHLSACSP